MVKIVVRPEMSELFGAVPVIGCLRQSRALLRATQDVTSSLMKTHDLISHR